MKKIIAPFFIFSIFFLPNAIAQEKTLKEQALDEFKKEHYNEAIALLEKAVAESPEDAEIYYYLGFFNHYRASDSRPLQGYDFSYSQRIFDYLDEAISLNPDYGDAKYFYGAECSANAFIAMQNYDVEKLRYFYQKACDKGAYPAWLVEFGKNIMNSCGENAILFTGGNADFDICSYLQLCRNYRKDITVIPLGNIDRPWYVKFLKDGLDGGVQKVNINLTGQQIMDIHPFKWDTTDVYIPVSGKMKTAFGLHRNYQLKWEVQPDLSSNRMHSKMEGETAKRRTYLSPQRAILLQIVENNYSERPIYFSRFSAPEFYGGLDAYFQNGGLTSCLVPVKTANTDYAVNIEKLEALLAKANFTNYATLKTSDIPRISGVALFGYNNAFMLLAKEYQRKNQTEKLNKLIEIYKSTMAIGIDPELEDEVLTEMMKGLSN